MLCVVDTSNCIFKVFNCTVSSEIIINCSSLANG